MSQNLAFDPDSVRKHVGKVITAKDDLSGIVSGSASADISDAFGIMCSFLATDFMAMVDAVEEGLTKARNNFEKTGTDMTDGVVSLEGVDTESTNFINTTNQNIADVGTDALRIALRLQ